jgi:hypothetical protein
VGDDPGERAIPVPPGGVMVNVGYKPTDSGLGDDTGEGAIPVPPGGVMVNVGYKPTDSGLGDDTLAKAGINAAISINVFSVSGR